MLQRIISRTGHHECGLLHRCVFCCFTCFFLFIVPNQFFPILGYGLEVLLIVVAEGHNQRLPLLSLAGNVRLIVMLGK